MKIGLKTGTATGGKKKRAFRLTVDRRQILTCLAAVLLVLAAGVICEYACNMRILSLPRQQRGIFEVAEGNIRAEGFVKTDKGWELTEEKGTLTVELGGWYIDKLAYSYDYDHLLNATAYVCYYNGYGEADPEQDMVIEDRNSKLVKTSYLNIGEEVDHVQLTIDRNELGESGSREAAAGENLTVTGFEICNVAKVHWARMGFFWALFGMAAFFWIFRQAIGKRIEIGFAAACLTIGILMVSGLPVTKVGYDEETHFMRAMEIASFPWGMNLSPAAWNKMIPSLDDWPENQPGSLEEEQQIEEYFDTEGDYKNGTIHPDVTVPKGSVPAYLGQAVLLKIGKGLGLPLAALIRLGRLGNLLVYTAIMFFAIKKTPVGKAIMSAIGLLPTSVFMACIYGYDASVTAWIYLSAAWMLKEILTPQEKITWKSYAMILVTFVLGCGAKAVYAPMILIGLLLPKSKFRDKKQMIAMRTGFILVLLGLLASFVLPVLIAPKEVGDVRGGATSEVGQMSYILGHPLAYAEILLKNIFHQLPKFTFGTDIFSAQGHLAEGSFTWLSGILVVYAIVTDTRSPAPETLSGRQKLWIFLTLAAAVALVWTSMYIAYTVPGNLIIAGVQGRYYLPVLFLFYLLFNSRTVIARIENVWYHTGVLAVSAAVLLITMWQTVIVPCCL